MASKKLPEIETADIKLQILGDSGEAVTDENTVIIISKATAKKTTVKAYIINAKLLSHIR